MQSHKTCKYLKSLNIFLKAPKSGRKERGAAGYCPEQTEQSGLVALLNMICQFFCGTGSENQGMGDKTGFTIFHSF